MPTNEFETVAPEALDTVAGGASRVSTRSGSNDQLTLMLTQITSSIKDLANKPSGGMDPMMLMMMMGGGGGGAGAGAAAAAPSAAAGVAATPVINIDAAVGGGGGGGGRGKKGW